MPNWCHNKMVVMGPPEQVQAFVAKASTPETALTFEAHVPMPPEEELEAYRSDFAGGWYIWSITNWGTKWDAKVFGRPEWEMVDTGAALDFETAWSPPLPWLVECSRQEPALSFVLSWAEPGSGQAGEYRARRGSVTVRDRTVEDVLGPEERWF